MVNYTELYYGGTLLAFLVIVVVIGMSLKEPQDIMEE